jgi:hypothetical protein
VERWEGAGVGHRADDPRMNEAAVRACLRNTWPIVNYLRIQSDIMASFPDVPGMVAIEAKHSISSGKGTGHRKKTHFSS